MISTATKMQPAHEPRKRRRQAKARDGANRKQPYHFLLDVANCEFVDRIANAENRSRAAVINDLIASLRE